MNDPQMNDILARLNSVGTKPASPATKSSNSAGDPAMHEILSRFHSVSGKYQVNEGLGAEQRKVGQLGPTDKPSKRKDHPFKGKLVGEDVEGGVDTLTMGIPLFIRMLEYAREEAQTDADLHHVTKKMMDMGGNVTMDDYDEIMSSVGGVESEMDEAVGDKLTDLEYGSATATATPTVGGYHQRRDLETGSYTDYTDRGPISTQTTYDKSGQMTSQHAQARVGDQSMAKSRFYPKKKVGEAEYHTTVGSMMDKGQGKWDMDALSDAGIDKYAGSYKDQLQKDYGDNWRDKVRQGVRDIKIGGSIDDYGSTASAKGYVDVGGARTNVSVDGVKGGKNDTNSMAGSELSVNGHTFKAPKFDKNTTQQQAADYATQQAKKLFQDQHSEMRKLAGLATEDYVGGKEAPQDLVKSLSKSYRDFVKEVEQQSAAQPDRELRSKKEKTRKFSNILGEE